MNSKEEQGHGHSVHHQVYLDIGYKTVYIVLHFNAAASVGCPVSVLQGQATGAVMYPVCANLTVTSNYFPLKILFCASRSLLITFKCRHVFFIAFWFCILERKINKTLFISPPPLYLITLIMKRKNSELGEVNCCYCCRVH